jgi:hypothetical protein
MFKFGFHCVILTAASVGTIAVSAQEVSLCRLCAAPERAALPNVPPQPLRIEVETALDFSRVAMADNGGGDIRIDPHNGARQVGGGLIDLGGMPVRGTVRLFGVPGRAVRIDLPQRVQLRSNTGAIAEVVDLATDLSPAPMLGPDGMLSFSFGGRLTARGAVSGNFRGSIAITADYQ